MADRQGDLRRSARLLLGSAAGPEALRSPAVRRALRSRRTPPAPVRLAQLVRRARGGLEYEHSVAEPMMAARRSVLGADAEGPPRFLVRVDEFPHAGAADDPQRYGTDRYLRFHETMRRAGVPYLVAVLPRVSSEPLDPDGTRWRGLQDDERELLGQMPAEGVSYALHGLDHRTRHSGPRHRSELCGLSPAATEELIETALAELAQAGVAPKVFVPPYNRFDASQYEILARHFEVVCGGPESVGLVGFQRTPVWRGDAVYLPAYHPLYARASEVLPAATRLIEARAALWVPIALHWAWEDDEGWESLERLLGVIGPHTSHWDDFLDAVAVSRGA